MPARNALSLRELRTAGRGDADRPSAFLAGLSLDVPAGDAVALLGRDRGANTAVLRAASGLLDVVGGRVLAEGRNVTDLAPHRRRLALAAPDHGLLGLGGVGAGTVRSAVRVAARGVDVRPILLATGLAEQAQRKLTELPPSGLRRVAVAQAVASAPICLLLDEPARGLDPAGASEVFAALHRVRLAGMAMLIATSDTRTALAVAERGVVMVEGAARQAGWLRDLHDSPADDATGGLLGEINRLPGRVLTEEDDIVTVRLDCGPIVEARREDAPVGTRCVVCVRPGRIALADVTADLMGPAALSGRVCGHRFFGDIVWVELEIGTDRTKPPATLGVARPAVMPTKLAVGDTVAIAWQPHHAMAFRPMRGE